MSTIIELTEDEFDQKFPLLQNHLNRSSGWVIDTVGYLFETHGEEFEFVRAQSPDRIWTLIDGDGGLYLTSGLHYVNRLGYLVSLVPFDRNHLFIVTLDG